MSTARGSRLLAANFHDNRIDGFDGSFHRVNGHDAFRSVGIPHGYAPFDVAVLGNRVFVSYAKQDADRMTTWPAPATASSMSSYLNGRFLHRFASRGVLTRRGPSPGRRRASATSVAICSSATSATAIHAFTGGTSRDAA